MERTGWKLCATLLLLTVQLAADQQFSFNYKRELLGSPSSLTLSFSSVDMAGGIVMLNGADSRQPTTPFAFDWGDGQTTTGFFPQQHHYAPIKNYIVTVMASYGNGQTDSVQILVRMIAPSTRPIPSPAGFEVTAATAGPLPSTRLMYAAPSTLTPFTLADFGVVPQATVEYVLTMLASVERDMVNDNLELIDGSFRQQVWKDATGGFYTLWYTNPVSIAAGNQGFRSVIPWSSLAHEMGHNFTLNFPASYIYGGKIDGNANTIYSEAMAQIFQHAAIYEVANNSISLGLGVDLAFDLAQDARNTLKVVRQNYDDYLRLNKPFATWNNSATPTDETLLTFMTIAYEFLANVEQGGNGYRLPVKRLTAFLQRFNADWANSYAPNQNTIQADTFRSTLMVAAISYGVGKDLRENFRNLGFPVSDSIFNDLNSGLSPMMITSVKTAWAGPAIAQNTWIEIKGMNLVPSSTQAAGVYWNSAPDFASGRLLTQLDGVRVSVDGKPAYVWFYCSAITSSFCTSDQINVLTPLDSAVGPVQVVVTIGTASSAPFVVKNKTINPSFLLFSSDRHVVATHTDFSLLGPTSLYPGLSTPARHLEEIILWAVGFGMPSASLVEGSATQSGSLPAFPDCQIGGNRTTVNEAVLVSPGLYALFVTVPDGAAHGDNQVVCTYNGSATTPGDLIAVE